MLARSVWFPAPRHVELRGEALPAVQPGEVRIRAIASAISQGTEMLVFRGQVPDGLELDLPTLQGSFAFPIKYGYASAGQVVESRSPRFEVGDYVFVLHPHQTEYVVHDTLPCPLQPDLDPCLGVFLANVETAVNIVLDAAPRIGERVVVFGQGVVGLLITQLLRRTGVAEIVVVDPISRRRDLALSLGADRAFKPDELEAGLDFDVAIEASGNPAALDLALASVAFGATVVVCSWYGTKPVPVLLGGPFHRRRVRIVSSQVGTIDASLQPRWTHARRLSVARDLLPQLQLESLVTHRFPIEAAAEAYRLVDQSPQETIQVMFTYSEPEATSRR